MTILKIAKLAVRNLWLKNADTRKKNWGENQPNCPVLAIFQLTPVIITAKNGNGAPKTCETLVIAETTNNLQGLGRKLYRSTVDDDLMCVNNSEQR